MVYVKKINPILKEVLEKVKPPKKDLEIIQKSTEDFLKKFERKLKLLKIDAEAFIGGSFAKNTVIKKDKYDVDVFVRFNPDYDNEKISGMLEKALKQFKNVSKIHGSRDYFRLKIRPDFFIEIIPVKKIKKVKEAENITDLSYFHVKYINRKIKSSEIFNEIRIAKAFCYANHCYGAESYIHGFSGYSLELLIYYYKSFIKFIKAMSKIKEKTVIDIEKKFKNKKMALIDINSAKLESPIVLVDPTYKYRNVLAALSDETFKKFQKACKNFLKNPSMKYFEIQKTDLEKIKKDSKKRKYEFILIEAKTNKQEGDIAGSKLLKFYNHLYSEIKDFFEIKKKGFNYGGLKTARYFFVVKKKKEIAFKGPRLKDKKHVERFKKKHKKTFSDKKRIYSKEKINFTLKDFINNWKKKNRKKLREMNITGLKNI